jgi:hypothetical protein
MRRFQAPISGKYWKVFGDRYVFDDGQFYLITARLGITDQTQVPIFEEKKGKQETFFLSKKAQGPNSKYL